jgi:hypothetical protein
MPPSASAPGPSGETGLVAGLVEDGRPLLTLTAVALLLSGLFALFLSARREFLPHDIAFLGLTADELCAVADCRVVRFMFHDRVAFGGTLMAVALLYLWLAAFPLRDGFRWAWQAFAVSGVLGFASFLAYLGYGYLDTWHGTATLALFPCFAVGVWRSRRIAVRPAPIAFGNAGIESATRAARIGLLATAAGLILAGGVIVTLGSSLVFVPQDLQFMGLERPALEAVNPHLVPLIAHDRAGFGGGLLTVGVLVAFCICYAPTTRALLQTLVLAGTAGFGCAIGVHFVEGYTDAFHLAPAWIGALLFYGSLARLWVTSGRGRPAAAISQPSPESA